MTAQISELECLRRSFNQIFGEKLTISDLSKLCSQMQRIELSPRQEFWNSMTSAPGLYIVATGRVRLIDRDRNLLTTLSAEQTFGELTLFPEDTFAPYSARSTQENVILYRLTEDVVNSLTEQYPQSQDILHQLAVQKYTFESAPSGPSVLTSTATRKNNHYPILNASTYQSAKSTNYWPSPTLQVGHFWQHITKRYPFFAQQGGADCGAACLVMVGRYWGQTFNVSRLRELANVNRDGASLSGLAAAAEKVGFLARPVQGHLAGLAKARLPAIVHWDGKHFIVVYAIASSNLKCNTV
jgi:Peptidase C39 family/Cyclic nucleotide-binding domain